MPAPGQGPAVDPPPDELVGEISVTPASTTVFLNGTVQRVRLQATAGQLGDISERAVWSLSDTSIGTISHGELTTFASVQLGGTYTVSAALGRGRGEATLNLKMAAPDVVDPGAPADARDWFGGDAGGPAPTITYPADDTMLAPNVLQMTLQWRAASDQTLFRVRVTSGGYEQSFYVSSSRCVGGLCSFDVDDATWSALAGSSLDQALTIEVASVSGKGSPLGVAEPIHIRFAPEALRGGLYYFSTTTRGIKRVPIGASKPVDFIVNGDETGCAGCHAVSRDGKKVALEYGSGQTLVGSAIVDSANSKLRNWSLSSATAWNFAWFNPTGDKLITNWQGALSVRSAKDGTVLSTVTPAQIGGPGGAMPEWSPDGRYIAFVRQPALSPYDFELVDSGDIMVMPYNGGAFGPAVELVHGRPGTEVHFWPSWSPDSKWLVFDSMTCGSQCNQYNATTTRLRLVRAIDDAGKPAVGAKPIELLKGTHVPNKTNNWPKFAPFLQKDRYAWVVYSATYALGRARGGTPQLFMFSLDLELAKKGMDASFRPFWLPFQENTTNNHSAIFTTDVACKVEADCPAEFSCKLESCVPRT